jgi:hypothetical protein
MKLSAPLLVVFYIVGQVMLILIGTIVILTGRDNTIVVSIGTSVVATGVAGIVITGYVQLQLNKDGWIERLARFGFTDAFEGRSAGIKSEYAKRLEKVHSNIDIMGFGLRTLRQDFGDDFSRWQARAKVRILLLDPERPLASASYAAQRDTEEQNTVGTIAEDVRQFIRSASPAMQGGFEVRLYTCLPSVNLFRIDDEAFWGPYFVRQQSRNSPTFIVKRSGVMFPILLKHFEEIWNDNGLSRPVPEEWR